MTGPEVLMYNAWRRGSKPPKMRWHSRPESQHGQTMAPVGDGGAPEQRVRSQAGHHRPRSPHDSEHIAGIHVALLRQALRDIYMLHDVSAAENVVDEDVDAFLHQFPLLLPLVTAHAKIIAVRDDSQLSDTLQNARKHVEFKAASRYADLLEARLFEFEAYTTTMVSNLTSNIQVLRARAKACEPMSTIGDSSGHQLFSIQTALDRNGNHLAQKGPTQGTYHDHAIGSASQYNIMHGDDFEQDKLQIPWQVNQVHDQMRSPGGQRLPMEPRSQKDGDAHGQRQRKRATTANRRGSGKSNIPKRRRGASGAASRGTSHKDAVTDARKAGGGNTQPKPNSTPANPRLVRQDDEAFQEQEGDPMDVEEADDELEGEHRSESEARSEEDEAPSGSETSSYHPEDPASPYADKLQNSVSTHPGHSAKIAQQATSSRSMAPSDTEREAGESAMREQETHQQSGSGGDHPATNATTGPGSIEAAVLKGALRQTLLPGKPHPRDASSNQNTGSGQLWAQPSQNSPRQAPLDSQSSSAPMSPPRNRNTVQTGLQSEPQNEAIKSNIKRFPMTGLGISRSA
ncbi:hypothetical protein IE81DRAFT_104564 [Ceraceosorus guamensis]|uniref:Uncharacterized protein n=1 Tax=Ceraceosorus guamensis TaxID=1522189 RepID=A0A316W2T4_9BASI|nr:hypothetical protein IE81DRAFT_104564 [Ceraceosorus guamensis]PWN43103.1 hypothetical protein IE81DRAFT_104564 [Ceraceosorus guamensis]